MSELLLAPAELGMNAAAGNHQEEVNAPAIAAATLGQVVPVRVCLNFRVALSKNVIEALLQQQAVKRFPLLRREPCRLQIPAGTLSGIA